MERKRYLMVWGDNSTLLNRGHLLLTVNSVYDEALYYTNEEMKAKGKGDIDVQSIVERPQVYILGRCGSSEVDQLAYINTRKACLLENRKGVMLDVQVVVVMQESTKTLQFLFPNLTLLFQNG